MRGKNYQVNRIAHLINKHTQDNTAHTSQTYTHMHMQRDCDNIICARTGGPGLKWETIDRCINYSSRGQNSLCTWENLLTLPCHQYIRGLPRSINSFNVASIYTCTCTCRYFVDTCNCNFIACVHFLYLLASPCMNQTKHTEGI